MGIGKVAIIGANGQLGSDLIRVFGQDDVLPLTHEDLEIADEAQVKDLLESTKPAWVINTAGYHNTSLCELHPIEAYRVNSVGPLNLAKACEAAGSVLVQISTDYVFDGIKRAPYLEHDPPSPLNVYGLSKIAGELTVTAYCSRHYVVRTSGLYGLVPCRAKGDNFVTKIAKVAREKGEVTVVTDEYATPTWTYSLAEQLRRLTEADVPFGIVHATDEGCCSWYEFTQEIFRLMSVEARLKPAKVADSPRGLRRPHYSVLENGVLKKSGVNAMGHWKDSLAQYLELASSERAQAGQR